MKQETVDMDNTADDGPSTFGTNACFVSVVWCVIAKSFYNAANMNFVEGFLSDEFPPLETPLHESTLCKCGMSFLELVCETIRFFSTTRERDP